MACLPSSYNIRLVDTSDAIQIIILVLTRCQYQMRPKIDDLEKWPNLWYALGKPVVTTREDCERGIDVRGKGHKN